MFEYTRLANNTMIPCVWLVDMWNLLILQFWLVNPWLEKIGRYAEHIAKWVNQI